MKHALFLGLLSGIVFGANIVENLPAGGKFVFDTKWDKYTINCTADPVTPSVVSQSCTCTQYDMKPWTGMWRFKLRLSTVLSNGLITDLLLSDGHMDLKACQADWSNHFKDTCSK